MKAMKTCLAILSVAAICHSALFLGGPVAAQEMTVSDEPVKAFARALAELGAGKAPESEDFATLDPVGPSDGTVLINGQIVNPEDFPALFRKTSGSNCTSALIGPAAILTAAHCVTHGSTVGFRAAGRRVRAVCEQAPGFRNGTTSEDWALCLLENEVRGIPYETVDLSGAPASGTPIFLTGFGCTATGAPGSPGACQEDFQTGDRTLRMGLTNVVPRPAMFANRRNTIFGDGRISAGTPVLCPGDSGGPAFIIPNGSPRAIRRLVGVNSATCILGDRGVSLIAAVSSAPGAAFLRDWAMRREQTVCGVNGSSLPNCAF
jgi:hypothetical protein